MKSERKYSLLEAKSKIEAWCAYQDRCFSEVERKLRSYGLDGEDVDRLVAELIRFDFLNEERFARSYCSGKFRMKGWGRIKIRQYLKQKQVNDRCIKYGMEEIDPDEYYKRALHLAERKWDDLRSEKNSWNKKAKVLRYLTQRGYESDIANEVLNELVSSTES